MLLAIASGLVLAFALPRPGHWLLAWIGLIPLFAALRNVNIRGALLCGLITGLTYFGIDLYWITIFGHLPWMVLCLYQALYVAVFAGLYLRLSPGRIGWMGYVAVPAVWVVLQFVRTLGAYGFTWGSFAHTQADNLVIAQIATITGPWGIDFLVCLANLVLATAIFAPRRKIAPVAVTGLLTVAVCVFGVMALSAKPAPGQEKHVAIVQGGLSNGLKAPPNYIRRAWDTYSRLTMQAAVGNPDDILWPETSLPVDLSTPTWDMLLGRLATAAHSELLVGGYDMDAQAGGNYNSLFRCNAHIEDEVYHKVQLVPFGEFVPLRDRLPFLNDYGVRPEDVLPGTDHILLNSRIGRAGTSVCFESLFPAIARTETLRGAQVLLVITNDSWFGHSQAAREHLLMAKLRAIENRRYVLRAAETGISAVIDPLGRVRHQLGLFQQGTISGTIVPSTRLSFYTACGDWFAYASIVITVLGLALSARKPKAESHAGPRRGI